MHLIQGKALFAYLLASTFCLTSIYGASLLPGAASQQPWEAEGMVAAELIQSRGMRIENQIHTEFTFRREEGFYGEFPAYFKVYAPGGRYRNEAKADSRLPEIRAGETYVLFLNASNSRLQFKNGILGVRTIEGADLEQLRGIGAVRVDPRDFSEFSTDPLSISFSVSDSGLLDSNGPKRFVSPDGGIPIPVVADVSTLPDGLTEAEALQALENALAAWENASSVLFDLQGMEVFTQSADSYSRDDGYVIRVQMHDNFGEIPDDSSTLAFGGSSFTLSTDFGGVVDGRAFNRSNFGYVVMDHPKSSLRDKVAFEEVLTHELGHAIGLAHSSETPSEPDAYLAEAIMYYQAHFDGRGAQLSSYDNTTIVKAYPLNTPPYGVDQIFYAITKPSGSLSHPEVNQIELDGIDLQGDPLSVQFVDQFENNNGSFTLDGTELTFVPSGYFSDATTGDLESSYFARYRYRLSSGTHQSPVLQVRNVGFRGDSYPAGNPDGLPDAWVSEYFGSSSAALADEDPDADGLTNLEEFLLESDPTDPDSRLKVEQFEDGRLTWSSEPFGAYRLQRSTDLASWTTIRLYGDDVSGGNLSASGIDADAGTEKIFYRVEAVSPIKEP